MILKNPKDLIPYVLIADRGQDNPPTFWFHPWTIEDFYKFKGLVKTRVKAKEFGEDIDDQSIEFVNEDSVREKLFVEKIVKVSNIAFPDEEPKELTAKPDIIKLQSWMSPGDVLEITNAIQNERGLTEDEKKK